MSTAKAGPGGREPYTPNELEPDSDSPTEMELSRIEKPELSVKWAYAYLLTLGWMGVHRFYLRRWYSGLLYAISFGFLGLGLILDLILLPWLTKWSRAEIDAQFLKHPKRFRVWPERVAPWARQDRRYGRFDLQVAVVALYWLVGPPFLAMICVMFGVTWGPVYLAIMLLVVAFAGSAQNLMRRYPSLAHIPLVGLVLDYLIDVEEFYYENRPRPLLYYLAFPLTAPIGSFISRRARVEAGFLLWPAGVVLASLGMDFFWSFGDHFRGSIESGAAAEWIAVVVICGAIVVTMFFMPTVATALTLNLSGRRRYTQLFVVLAIAVGIPTTLLTYSLHAERLTLPSAQLLEARLGHEKFRASFSDVGRMLLGAHRPKTPLPPDLSNATVERDDDLTETIRTLIEGYVPESETAAFSILNVRVDGDTVLTVLHYDAENDRSEPPDGEDICERQPLVVADSKATYTRVADFADVVDVAQLADRFGQGPQTYLLDDWPCGYDDD